MTTDFSFETLDLSNVTANTGPKNLQPGKYVCKVADAKIEATKDGTGRKLSVRLIDISNKGSILHSFNVANKNPKAVEIGLEQLKGMLVLAGHPNPERPSSVSTLNGLIVGVLVRPQKDNPIYSEVGGFLDPKSVAGYELADIGGNSEAPLF